MASARENETLTAGQHAPDFKLKDLDGGERRLADLLPAGPVLLAFFKVSCPTCQFTLPFLDRIHRGGAGSAARMFVISQDDAEVTREFHKEFGITMPTLLDAAQGGYPASNAYGLAYVPTMFLIERDGTISWSLTGFNRKELDALGRKFGVSTFRPGERVPEMKSG
ncbi:MAG TPA: TlpA disulfide reductase family protein [Bryobacteraceae bacterium]|nr:TlpA disulfide reductase family protein [Bryobacteraceae bacterium]